MKNTTSSWPELKRNPGITPRPVPVLSISTIVLGITVSYYHTKICKNIQLQPLLCWMKMAILSWIDPKS